MAKDTQQWRGENSAARNVRSPEPAAWRTHQPRSWESESSVGQELQRRVASVELGYEVSSSDAALSGVHAEEIALGVAPNMHRSTPSLSKLERMTGNQLSNDLYEGRTSGQGQSRDSNGLSIRNQDKDIFGYPKLNTNISYTPHQPDLNLYTDLSPSTTIEDFEFSPISPKSVGETTALAPRPPPPPRPSAAQMAVAYPNIAALAQVNRAASDIHPRRHSSRTSFSFREQGQNITEHIASQFNPAKRGRLRLAFNSGRRRSSTRLTRNHAPPLSAAFGGFTELDRHKTTRDSRASSISTFRFGTTVEDDPPPLPTPTAIERHSWSGRSVLFLDEMSRWAGRGPKTPIRPVDEEQIEGGPSLSRTLSASKASISSMFSSISSLNTLSGGFTGGLSPTPAPRPPRTADGISANSQAPSVILQEQQLLDMGRIWEIADEESQERKKTPRSRDDGEDDNDEHQPERSSFVFL
ncbi:hypothetical protein K440DRAFT_618277 [Wilcoxina mikolae CBS 423.85]|nr:hypothetical protein K440DRAFT_618277 [Wilcoxina mikolae CBS 423.85]